MAIPVGNITSVPAASTVSPASASSAPSAPTSGTGFGESLSKLLESSESASDNANTAIDRMLNREGDVHEAMIALQRAELTLQFTVQVRNKLVQAYQEIMRMPV